MSAGAMRAGEWPAPSQPVPLSADCQSGLAASRHHTHLSSLHDHPPAPARGHCVTESFDRLSLALADRYRIVGYESPSQFSREYVRLFGAPPVRDIARLQAQWGNAVPNFSQVFTERSGAATQGHE